MPTRIAIICGLALTLLGPLAWHAAAQTSCSGWNATCRERCGKSSCPRCAQQMSNCKKSGCWTEGAAFGGAKHCNLKKS